MTTIFFTKVVQVLVAIAMMRVMTTLLSPTEVGATSLALSVSAMFNLALINPIWMYMLRRAHEWQRTGVLSRRIFGAFAWYLAGVSALVPLLLVAAAVLGWSGSAGFGTLALAAISLHFATMSASMTIPLMLNVLGQLSAAASLNAGIALSSLVGCVLAVKLFGATMQAWLFGFAGGYTVVMLVGLPIFIAKFHDDSACLDTHRDADFAAAWKFLLPLAVSVIFFWTQLYGYRFIFAAKLGAYRLGLFFSGYGLGAAVVNTIEAVLTQYFQPIFYRRISTNDPIETAAAWEEYASKMLPSLLLCIAFTAGAEPFMAKILLGAKFQMAAKFAVWGAAAEALRAALGVFSMSAHARSETHLLLRVNAVGAATAVLLAFALVPRLGEIGAGLALVMSFLCAIAVLYHSIGRRMPLRVAPKTIGAAVILSSLLLLGSAGLRGIASGSTSMLFALGGLTILGMIFAATLISATGLLAEWTSGWMPIWR